MHKKYHKKFKILDILAVTTQAREGIETLSDILEAEAPQVTTQAREGIETQIPRDVRMSTSRNNSSPWGHWNTAILSFVFAVK